MIQCRCDRFVFSARPERAVRPGSHIAARGFERTIVIIAESRYGACRYGKLRLLNPLQNRILRGRSK